MVNTIQDSTNIDSESSMQSEHENKRINPGRNLVSAVIVGAILGILVIVPLFYVPNAWFVVVTGAVAISVIEVVLPMRAQGVYIAFIPLVCSSMAMVVASNYYGVRGLLVAVISVVLINMVWLLAKNDTGSQDSSFLKSLSLTVLVVVWVPLLAACSVLMIHEAYGTARVFSFIIIAVGSDISGYVCGVLFGKHQLAPRISPKKTWEGLLGSIIGGTALSYWSLTYFTHFPSLIALCSGPIIVLVACCGDLIESQIKRDLHIKDMGSLLPGHGGLMDRLDSILPSAGAAWVLWQFIL